MTKIVKEFIIRDGIGAQLARKLYSMSYAHHMGYLFEDTPITDFFNHPSDNIKSQEDKDIFIKNFSSLIKNPWSHINFSEIENKEYCEEVGFLNTRHQGQLHPETFNFRKHSNLFSNISPEENSNIVFHIRRGNVVKKNPRWIDEEEYLAMVSNVDKVIEKLGINNPNIIILTDSSDNDQITIPDNEIKYWRQPFLMSKIDIFKKDPPKTFKMTSFDESIFDNLKYDITILKNYDTYKSFLLMCQAKVLFTNRSAFSKAASFLSKTNVIDYTPSNKNINRLNTSIGYFDPAHKDIFFYEV